MVVKSENSEDFKPLWEISCLYSQYWIGQKNIFYPWLSHVFELDIYSVLTILFILGVNAKNLDKTQLLQYVNATFTLWFRSLPPTGMVFRHNWNLMDLKSEWIHELLEFSLQNANVSCFESFPLQPEGTTFHKETTRERQNTQMQTGGYDANETI